MAKLGSSIFARYSGGILYMDNSRRCFFARVRNALWCMVKRRGGAFAMYPGDISTLEKREINLKPMHNKPQKPVAK